MGGVTRPLPVIAVAHARRLVEEDDDFACTRGRGGGQRPLLEERTGEGEHQQRDRGTTHREQQPMTDTPPPDRLVGNALQEHQRRKQHDTAALALDQVHEHRDRDGGKGREEEGTEK